MTKGEPPAAVVWARMCRPIGPVEDEMQESRETKREIRARIDELERLGHLHGEPSLVQELSRRLQELHVGLHSAQEDLFLDVIRSHKALCRVKKMGEKEAYGNDPAVYYTLGVCGEAGEMANAIVKAQRNGNDRDRVLAAVKSELPDVIIYAYVLAYVLDIDLPRLVSEKVDVVVQRALDGYYGGPLERKDGDGVPQPT